MRTCPLQSTPVIMILSVQQIIVFFLSEVHYKRMYPTYYVLLLAKQGLHRYSRTSLIRSPVIRASRLSDKRGCTCTVYTMYMYDCTSRFVRVFLLSVCIKTHKVCKKWYQLSDIFTYPTWVWSRRGRISDTRLYYYCNTLVDFCHK